MEYKMLNLFLKNPKQVLTRQQLLERLWDVDEKYVDEHTLTTVSYTHLDVYKRQDETPPAGKAVTV